MLVVLHVELFQDPLFVVRLLCWLHCVLLLTTGRCSSSSRALGRLHSLWNTAVGGHLDCRITSTVPSRVSCLVSRLVLIELVDDRASRLPASYPSLQLASDIPVILAALLTGDDRFNRACARR